ncbi:sensor histidine kinase [Paenibacillus sp.]|uniref:sensor histidine kinase n=1 Tax=Paenibacillus sp. TaxID=58172 RepID=UPI002D270BC1|nr:GHKL domain-containing protein [Paenibacillus sp.]HZG84616.1 GHKL domain-containing protein [Paenibacillus sp.]
MYDKLTIALEMALISTIPQAFACLFFTLTFWGYRVPGLFRRLTTFSLLTAVSFAGLMMLPESLRPLSFVSHFLLVAIVLRDRSWRERLTILATLVVLYHIIEITAAVTAIWVGTAEMEGLAADPRSVVPYLLFYNAILAAAASSMRYVRVSPGRSIHQFLSLKQNRLLTGLAALFVANVVFSTTLVYYVLDSNPLAAGLALVLMSFISILILFFTIRSISLVKNQAILTTQETYIEEINNLFTTIRGQRHDFLNHVQVIQAFVRKGKTEELERYVSELVGEIVEINDLIQIGHPALAALIKSKLVYALDRKISLRYSFEGMERIGRGIASVDYVKIAGNLLDNALDEVLRCPPEDRWVEIEGWTDDENFYLTVSNPAYSVTEEQKVNMFTPGYTTKTDGKHSGIGLSIVKERVGFYQGELDVESEPDHVLSFRVRLPLRLPSISS